MGTGSEDTGHGPQGPSGGSTLSQSEIAAKRAALKAQLADLPPEVTDPVPPQNPGQPLQVIQNPVEASPVGAPEGATTVYYAPAQPGQQSQEEIDAADPNVNPNAPFSHWIHLADGTVRKALGTVTHWHENDDPGTPGIPVVTAIANPAYKPGAGDRATRLRAVLAELKALGVDLTDIGL